MCPPPLLASVGFFATLIGDFSPDQRWTLSIVMVGCLTATVIVLGLTGAITWAVVRRRASEAELTRELLAEGRSAGEIERILHPSDAFARGFEKLTGQRRGDD